MSFPLLYRIALEPSAMVNDVLNTHNGNFSWNVVFGRDLQDWELDDYALFLISLYEAHIKVEDDDCSRWRLTHDGIFFVRTYFRSLWRAEENSFPWKLVWKCELLPRVAFLLWTVVRGQVLTVDNLCNRVFTLQSSAICVRGIWRRLITNFFIVMLPVYYGTISWCRSI